MYLYGASGHAKVIIDILKDNNISIEGLYDDNANRASLVCGYESSALSGRRRSNQRCAKPSTT